MNLLRAVRAEWPFLRIRLLRTRLGMWLLLLAAALHWVDHGDLPDVAARAGGYAAVLCVCYLAGSAADRVAVALPVLHGTSAGGVALGRWLAATTGAALVVLALAAPAAWSGAWRAALGGTGAGCATAAAMAAVALALVWCGGNVLGVTCLVWLVLLGEVRPEVLVAVPHPSAVREGCATILAAVPGLWRYSAIAQGAPGALLHAVAWTVAGLLAAARRGRCLARRG